MSQERVLSELNYRPRMDIYIMVPVHNSESTFFWGTLSVLLYFEMRRVLKSRDVQYSSEVFGRDTRLSDVVILL